MTSTKKYIVALFVVLVGVTSATQVLASEVFLAEVAEGTSPRKFTWRGECELCHESPVPDISNATTDFALAIKQRVPAGQSLLRNTQLLDAIFKEMYEAGVDTDEDGVSDIDELVQGSNPSDPECSVAGCYETYEGVPPEFGCVARVAPRSRGAVPWLGAALVVAGLLWSRSRHGSKNTK